MITLTDEQYQQLVGGRDCSLHSHSFDRSLSRDIAAGLQDYMRFKKVTAAYSATLNDDYILADSTLAAFAIALPLGKGSKEIEFIRCAGVNNVTINASGSDTINGAASLVINTSYSPVRLKFFKGTGWLKI